MELLFDQEAEGGESFCDCNYFRTSLTPSGDKGRVEEDTSGVQPDSSRPCHTALLIPSRHHLVC